MIKRRSIEFDQEDTEKIIELAESIKQQYGLKNIAFHYEDLPEQYWWIETLE